MDAIAPFKQCKHILLFGDYDVDGISSVALAADAIRTTGCQATCYIPHRISDGYGIRWETFQKILATYNKPPFDGLLIFDSGTNQQELLGKLIKIFPRIVVFDHHQPNDASGQTYPCPIFNSHWYPGLEDCCSAVWAWIFATGFLRLHSQQLPKRSLGLAALATVADVCPLLRTNRCIVKFGLPMVKAWPGLACLMNLAGIDEVTTDGVRFKLGPRLNAAGRMDSAKIALDLILATPQSAPQHALILEQLNTQRRALQEAIMAEVTTQISAQAKAEAYVVAGTDWPIGLVGIIAGRVCDMTGKPAIALSSQNDFWQGSGRVPPGHNFLEYVANLPCTLHCGGHSRAFGIAVNNVPTLITHLSHYVPPALEFEEPEIYPINPSQINIAEAHALAQLAPFGIGNPEPLLLVEGKWEHVRDMKDKGWLGTIHGAPALCWKSQADPFGKTLFKGYLRGSTFRGIYQAAFHIMSAE
jgi:single-stranded-DNA-specific exonuclease